MAHLIRARLLIVRRCELARARRDARREIAEPLHARMNGGDALIMSKQPAFKLPLARRRLFARQACENCLVISLSLWPSNW